MPRPYRSARGRKPREAVLMGEPSPALAKIAKMNSEKLTEYIETLEVEAERLDVKAKNLLNVTPVDEERIADLHKQRKRLDALMEVARERLSGKMERRQQRGSDGNRR